MTTNKPGLGRGLEALIPTAPQKTTDNSQHQPGDDLNPGMYGLINTDGSVRDRLPITLDEMKDLYADMVEARAYDTKSIAMQRQGRLATYAPFEGQEAAQIGAAAALIDGGKILSRHYKSLLPTYDVFDEARHFDPAPSVRMGEFRGRRLAITICEDFWNDRLYWRRRIYDFDPVEELARQNPDFMITISASPYSLGKPAIRSEMYSLASKRYETPLVHVNLVGGNDNLIFDGRSNVWGKNRRPHAPW